MRTIAVTLAGAVTVACLLLGTGAGLGVTHAAGDNGDGPRLFCGAGLVPATADGTARWKGVVVTDFVAGGAPCRPPQPSSALAMLRVATLGQHGPWDLRTLGALYALLIGLAVVVAAVALARVRPALVSALLPVVLPLAVPSFSRLLVSTYSEPAGLLGAVVMLCGIAVLAVAGDGPGRPGWAGPFLTLVGGAVAATAKPAYAALGLVAVAACLLSSWSLRRPGRALLAVATLAVVAVPVLAAVHWQQAEYGPINAHNVALTAVGPAGGGDALADMGLPPSYAADLGRSYYPAGPESFPQWDALIGHRWSQLRQDATWYVVSHPATALRLLGGGLRAATDPELAYLPSVPADQPGARPIEIPAVPVGEQGADGASLQPWLAERSLAVAVLVLVAGAAQAVALVAARRRLGPLGRALCLTGALGCASALAVVITAVLGDGYFEIAKHVWLAAYLGLVTALSGAGALLVALVGAVRDRRRPRAPALDADEVTLVRGDPPGTVARRLVLGRR